jgi:hypothetical protein
MLTVKIALKLTADVFEERQFYDCTDRITHITSETRLQLSSFGYEGMAGLDYFELDGHYQITESYQNLRQAANQLLNTLQCPARQFIER